MPDVGLLPGVDALALAPLHPTPEFRPGTSDYHVPFELQRFARMS